MKLFNEAESVAAEVVAEPTIEQAVVRKKKQKGQRQVDLSQLPVRKEQHELTEQQLTEIYGEGGWKRLPDEVFSRVEYTPAVREVVEHHVAVYAGKKEELITRMQTVRRICCATALLRRPWWLPS